MVTSVLIGTPSAVPSTCGSFSITCSIILITGWQRPSAGSISTAVFGQTTRSHVLKEKNCCQPPHSLYKGPQSLISGGFSEIWVDGIGRPCSAVAMLSPKRLNLGRGGQHESATGATGPGDPRET